jgi:hypothetical protein
MNHVGVDCDKYFEVTGHSKVAVNKLSQLLVGIIVDSHAVVEEQKKTMSSGHFCMFRMIILIAVFCSVCSIS